jgi:peptidoglycan/LPS O-acetylase OafA/YrhL
MSGAMLAVLWPWIGRHAVVIGAAGLISVLGPAQSAADRYVAHSLALAAAVVGLGSSSIMAWFSRGGDASYGMYVLAWPVQQFVLLLIAPFWLSLLVAFLATTALGYATWHAYERRLMAYPKRLAERRRFAI